MIQARRTSSTRFLWAAGASLELGRVPLEAAAQAPAVVAAPRRRSERHRRAPQSPAQARLAQLAGAVLVLPDVPAPRRRRRPA